MVGRFAQPAKDELNRLSQHFVCGTDVARPQEIHHDRFRSRRPSHGAAEQRWFEDFSLGERFVLPSRTMTGAVFAAFQTASGDTHPVHYDVEYCRVRGMPNLLAHGFQTLIHTAPGAGLFSVHGGEFAARISRTVEPVFKARIFADDTIYPALEVIELTPGRTTAWFVALHGVQSAPRACAGGIAEVSDTQAAGLDVGKDRK